MRKLCIAAISALIAGGSSAAFGDNVNWAKSQDGDWSQIENWTPHAPNAGDNVSNSFAGTTISFNTTASVVEFTDVGNFTMTGGSLSGTVPENGAQINVAGAFQVSGGTLSNLLIYPDGGSVTFSGGALNSMAIAASATFNGLTTLSGSNSFSDTETLTGGILDFADSTSLTLLQSGAIAGYGSIGYNANNGATTITNNGSISANTATQSLAIGATIGSFINNYTIGATAGGILNVSAPMSGSGSVTADTGGAVNVTSLWTGTNVPITANGGSVTSSGGLTGSFSTFGANGLTITAGTLTDTTLTGGVTFAASDSPLAGANTFNGIIDLSGSILDFQDNASLTIGMNSTLHGSGYIGYNAHTGTSLINNGTISADAGAENLFIYSPIAAFTNNGTLKATAGGTLFVQAILTGAGAVSADTGGTINVSALWTGTNTPVTAATGTITSTGGLSGSFSVSGANGLDITAGTISNTTLSGNINFNGSNTPLVGTNAFNGLTVLNASILDFAANASLTVGANGNLQGSGYIGYNANDGGTSLTNYGTIAADMPGQTLSIYGPIAQFDNFGMVLVSGGATLIVDAPWNNHGKSNYIDGTLTANGPVSGGGTFTAENGGTITFNGLLSGTNTIHGDSGTLFSGGGLAGTMTVTGSAGITLTGGTITSTTVNGNLVNSGFVGVAGANTLNGATLMSGGIFDFQTNASLTIPASASLHGNGYVGYNANLGGTSLINNGTITADAAMGTLYIYSPIAAFANNFAIRATNSATLIVDPPLTGAGSVTADNGGIVNIVNLWTGSNTPVIAPTGTVISSGGMTGSFTGSGGNGISLIAGALTSATIGATLNITGDIPVVGANAFNGPTYLNASILDFGDNASVSIGAAGSLHGTGYIGYNANNGGTSLINNSVITGDPGTLNLYTPIAHFLNNASLIAQGTVNIQCATTTNGGLFQATSGGTLQFIAPAALTNLNSNSLSGGTYEVDANSTIILPGSFTNNAASVILSGVNTTFAALAPLATNAGAFTIENGATFSTVADLANSSTVSITAASTLNVTGNYSQSAGLTVVAGTLNPTGTDSINGGTLRIGNAGNSGAVVGPIKDNGAVIFNRSDTAGIYSNAISGIGTVAMSGTGSVTLTGTNTYGGATIVNTGALVIGAVSALPASGKVVNNATFSVQAGSAAIPVVASQITGAGTLTIGAPSAPAALRLAFTPGVTLGSASTIGALSINTGSQLNITNHPLIITYATAPNDPVTTIRAELKSAYAAKYSGASLALTSTTAAATPSLFAVGYVDNTTTHQLTVSMTTPGDTNLSGATDFTDLTTVAQFFGQSIAKGNNVSWSTGDVNYDNSVDFSDLTIVAQYFGASLTKSQASELPASFVAQYDLALAEVGGATTSVPEPATIGLFAVSAGGLLVRRPRARTRRTR